MALNSLAEYHSLNEICTYKDYIATIVARIASSKRND